MKFEIWPPPEPWKIHMAHYLGERDYRERRSHGAVRWKDAGGTVQQQIAWDVYGKIVSFAFLSERGSSDDEAVQLLSLDWPDLPDDDKLTLSPFKLHAKTGLPFDLRWNHIYIGADEDTYPEDAVLVGLWLDVDTWTTHFYGWITIGELRRRRVKTKMWNRFRRAWVEGVPYSELEPPSTLDWRRPLRRLRRIA
jgi:hypothetical protein